MNCPNCGAKLEPNQKFCTSCGTDVSKITSLDINEPGVDFTKVMPSNSAFEQGDSLVKKVVSKTQDQVGSKAKRATQKLGGGVAVTKISHDENQILWLVGAFASLVQIFTIFKVPIVDLSKIIKTFTSFLSGTMDIMGGLSEELSQLGGIGSGLDKLINTISNFKYPLMSIESGLRQFNIKDKTNIFNWTSKIILILAIIVIVMTFVRKYTNITFIVAGGLTTVIYGFLYHLFQSAQADLKSSIANEIGTNMPIPFDLNIIGNGLYIGLFMALIVFGIGTFNLISTKKL